MPVRTAYLRRARHWIANRGLSGFLQQVRWRLGLWFQGKPLPGRPGPPKGLHPFDLAYNVDTDGLVWGEALQQTQPGPVAVSTSPGTAPEANYWATGYYGVAPSTLDTALDRLSLDWSRFAFVDIGCGKGRALLLASRHPFRRLLGIELSPTLAAAAQANLVRFNAPWRQPGLFIEVQVADATTVPLPDGPLLLFLYHPFAAPIMRRFLEHVRAAALAQPREIFMLYTNPELAPLVARTPGFTRVWDQWTRLTPEELAADRFDSAEEHTVLYRIEP